MTDDDPIERRRRKRREQARRKWLALAAAAVVLVAVGVTVAGLMAVGRGRTGIAAVDRSTWTHKELADYLRQKGIEVEIRPIPDIGGPGRPVSVFEQGADGPRVRVFLCADAQAAREEAGSWGSRAFAWGRFAVCSGGGAANDALLDRVRKALR